MPKFVPIDRKAHSDKAWRRVSSYNFAAKDAVVPIVGLELAQVAGSMPIAFIDREGQYTPVAVMSPVPNRNLFVSPDGNWLDTYIPSAYRAYPFRLMRAQGSDQSVLCVDEQSGLVGAADEPGERFLDDQGKPAPMLQSIADFLQQVEASRMATQLVVAALAKAGVIEPWPLRVESAGRQTSVQGLFRISEPTLKGLDDETFLALKRCGALPLAYAQLVSMSQTVRFEWLEKVRERLEQAPRLEPEEIFQTESSDIIRFD